MSQPISSGESKFSAPIDLRRVRRLFDHPASVAESAFLRREIAARMHERLALVKLVPHRLLDAGCGEGADLVVLQRRFPDSQVLGVDASLSMLATARSNHIGAHSSLDRLLKKWLPRKTGEGRTAFTELLCGDFAHLPMAHGAVDLIWSNLALHWHPQPDRVFAEWRRVLRVDGLLMFSCFGPDTFKELRSVFAEIDDLPHALPFVDMHDFGDMLVNAGFSTPVMDMEIITVTYETVDKLIVDVRAWGGNPLATRRKSLIGSQAWERAVASFDKMRNADGRIPLTFEVIYGHAFKPVARITSSGDSIIRFDRKKNE